MIQNDSVSEFSEQVTNDSKPPQERKLSVVEKGKILVTPFAAFNLIINVLFGTGPIYMPGVYLGSGWLMSTIITVFIGMLSWICLEFVIESMSNTNALMYLLQQSRIGNDPIQRTKISDINDNDPKQRLLSVEEEDKENKIIEQIENKIEAELDSSDEEDEGYGSKIFKLRKIVEFGQMSSLLFGHVGNILTTIILTVYLVGVLISKSIASSNILSGMFDDIGGKSVAVLNNYYFWLSLFSVTAIFLSFKDIGGIKIVQQIIVAFRFFVIALLIGGPLYIIGKGDGGGLTPISPEGEVIKPFHPSGFESYFSTAIFALLCHHSVPSIMTHVNPTQSKRKVGIISFLLGTLLLILISILGIAAFQGKMLLKGNISLYTRNFDGSINWIYYISSFYMFLNIAAFPVLVITIRNNIMKCFFPQHIPAKPWLLTKHSAIITICVVSPIVILSIVAKKNIEDVISVVGGIFGVFLMMLIPSFLVIFTRKKLALRKVDIKQNPNLSYFSHISIAWTVFVLGWCCLGFNLYQDIKKWTS